METRATEQNIAKHLKALKDLHLILSNTKRVSMLDFSVKNNITKNLSTVLQKGGIIKMVKQGRYPEWEWSTIPPTREMAIETLKRLVDLNPPRKEIKPRGGKREGSGRKPKSIENRYLDSFTVPLFFGLTKINIKLNYKS